ncbi:MAG: hypothetical protein IJ521_02470 [Schwartzia sp.]|nr:hypothetical protein [Schwartzia sp. (in: firmicutes)]
MTFAETFKEGGRIIRHHVAAALRDDKVTLRGEIFVTRPGITDVGENEVRATGVLAALAPLQTLFPGTKLTLEQSLLSIDIKFFCYEATPDSSNFQSALCHILEDAVSMIEMAGFETRLNARGEWERLNRVETFCCINKGKQVSCKATNDERRNFPFKTIRESASNAIERL